MRIYSVRLRDQKGNQRQQQRALSDEQTFLLARGLSAMLFRVTKCSGNKMDMLRICMPPGPAGAAAAAVLLGAFTLVVPPKTPVVDAGNRTADPSPSNPGKRAADATRHRASFEACKLRLIIVPISPCSLQGGLCWLFSLFSKSLFINGRSDLRRRTWILRIIRNQDFQATSMPQYTVPYRTVRYCTYRTVKADFRALCL